MLSNIQNKIGIIFKLQPSEDDTKLLNMVGLNKISNRLFLYNDNDNIKDNTKCIIKLMANDIVNKYQGNWFTPSSELFDNYISKYSEAVIDHIHSLSNIKVKIKGR